MEMKYVHLLYNIFLSSFGESIKCFAFIFMNFLNVNTFTANSVHWCVKHIRRLCSNNAHRHLPRDTDFNGFLKACTHLSTLTASTNADHQAS